MKVYFKDVKPSEFISKKGLKLVDAQFRKREIYNEIYSEEGVYLVENKKIYKIMDHGGTCESYDFCGNPVLIYKNQTMDGGGDLKEKEEDYQIPFKHISKLCVKFTYSVSTKSKVKLIIKGFFEPFIKQHDALDDKYYNFIPTDFYFEMGNEESLENAFVKEEIIGFLSLFN